MVFADVGGKVYHDFLDFTRKEREDSVKKAVRETQEAADRRLRKCLDDARRKAEVDKQQALEEARLVMCFIIDVAGNVCLWITNENL